MAAVKGLGAVIVKNTGINHHKFRQKTNFELRSVYG